MRAFQSFQRLLTLTTGISRRNRTAAGRGKCRGSVVLLAPALSLALFAIGKTLAITPIEAGLLALTEALIVALAVALLEAQDLAFGHALVEAFVVEHVLGPRDRAPCLTAHALLLAALAFALRPARDMVEVAARQRWAAAPARAAPRHQQAKPHRRAAQQGSWLLSATRCAARQGSWKT